MAPCLQRPDGTAGGVGELCDGLNNGQEKHVLKRLPTAVVIAAMRMECIVPACLCVCRHSSTLAHCLLCLLRYHVNHEELQWLTGRACEWSETIVGCA